MSAKITLARSLALGIFHFCGWSTAGKWDSAKMATKLQDVPSVAPEKEPEDEKIKAALAQVKEAVAAGNTFEIEDDVPVEEKAATKEKAPKEKKEKVVKEKVVKEKVVKEKVVRVTWLSAAAEVFKKNNFPVGEDTITDEMVKAVNEAKGAENDSLARNHLKVVQEVYEMLKVEAVTPAAA